jgi:hypothetical protein
VRPDNSPDFEYVPEYVRGPPNFIQQPGGTTGTIGGIIGAPGGVIGVPGGIGVGNGTGNSTTPAGAIIFTASFDLFFFEFLSFFKSVSRNSGNLGKNI